MSTSPETGMDSRFRGNDEQGAATGALGEHLAHQSRFIGH